MGEKILLPEPDLSGGGLPVFRSLPEDGQALGAGGLAIVEHDDGLIGEMPLTAGGESVILLQTLAEEQNQLAEIGGGAFELVALEVFEQFAFGGIVGGSEADGQRVARLVGRGQALAVHRENGADLVQHMAFADLCQSVAGDDVVGAECRRKGYVEFFDFVFPAPQDFDKAAAAALVERLGSR